MNEFRAELQEFLLSKREFAELKAYADRDYMMGHFDPNAVEAKGREIMDRYQEWRKRVARRLADATNLASPTLAEFPAKSKFCRRRF